MDPYRDIAVYYDCEHDGFDDDIGFYLEEVAGDPVLEVGSGTGRIMLPLVRSGLDVWGVDPSPAMLDRARTRLSGLSGAHLIHGTVANLPTGKRYTTVLLPLNTLWHFPDTRSQVSLLGGIRARLDIGARLLVDVSNPLTLTDRAARGELRERFSGACDGGYLRVVSSVRDDEAEQRLSLSLTYDLTDSRGGVKRTHVAMRLRYLYRCELELLLRLCGFDPLHVYGSYEREPYMTDSPNIVVVARAC